MELKRPFVRKHLLCSLGKRYIYLRKKIPQSIAKAKVLSEIVTAFIGCSTPIYLETSTSTRKYCDDRPFLQTIYFSTDDSTIGTPVERPLSFLTHSVNVSLLSLSDWVP